MISQDPTTGTLYRGDTVSFSVSLGPELVEVPRVQAMGVEAATDLLEGLGFTGRDPGGRHLPRHRLRLQLRPRCGRRGAEGLHDHALFRASDRCCPSLRACTSEPPGRTTLLASLVLRGAGRVLGIDVLPHQGPARPGADARLPGRALRRSRRSRCCSSHPARWRGSPPSCAGTPSSSACSTAWPRSSRPPGLAHTPASVSGFVTGLYVVCTPLLAAAILRTRIPPITWVAVALATVGLGVLALRGLSVGYGELITLASAVLYALHIVGLGAWSTARDAVGMTILQVIVIALVCTMATVHDGIVLPDPHGRLGLGRPTWRSSSGRSACSGRPGRRPTCRPPARRIIMSMEPVFASVFAVWLGGEDLTRPPAPRRLRWCSSRCSSSSSHPVAWSRARSRTSRSEQRARCVLTPRRGDATGASPYRGPVDTCVRCGADLGVGRFCLNCGHRIGEPAPVAAAPPVPARARLSPLLAPAAPARSRAGRSPVQAADPTPSPRRPSPGAAVDRCHARPRPGTRGPEPGSTVPESRARSGARLDLGPRPGPASLRGGRRARRRRPGARTGLDLLGARSGAAGRPGLRPARGLRHRRGRHHRDRRRRRAPRRPPTSRGRRVDGARRRRPRSRRRASASGSTSPTPPPSRCRAPRRPRPTSTATWWRTRPSRCTTATRAPPGASAGDASGQAVTITLPEPGVVYRVGLVNGYAKQVAGVDWYPNNRRILSVTWGFDDGTTVEQTFSERPVMQRLKVPPVRDVHGRRSRSRR